MTHARLVGMAILATSWTAMAAEPDAERTLRSGRGEDAGRWERGLIRADNEWSPFDAEPSPQRVELLDRYETRRALAGETAEEQLALADWCHEQGLSARERAHLVSCVLAIRGDVPLELRERLGQTWVAGGWRTPSEVETLREERERIERGLKSWQGRIERLARGLTARSDRARANAREGLAEIDDPAAVPALHVVLGFAGEEPAGEMVETLERFETIDATRALAFHAAFSPWESVREAATRVVRRRNPRHFVPVLLGTTWSPYRSRFELLTGPNDDVIASRWILEREGAGTREIDVLENRRTITRVMYDRRNDVRRSNRLLYALAEDQLALLDVNRREARTQQVRQDAVELANEVANEVNTRVAGVLRRVSRHDFGDDPEEMWRWWHDYCDLDYGYKPTTVRVNVSTHEVKRYEPDPDSCHSCLVAGTLVWTERGPRAIETITVGDLVLAKSPRTGELTHQPVLRKTVREPHDVVTFSLESGERITCTAGHLFWVNGKGWCLARDLEPGDPVHRATGTITVRDAPEMAGKETTHNLIVADFHSYFVGETAILSHDVTTESPTDHVIPGVEP